MTNSSSSSFVICKNDIDYKDIKLIEEFCNHISSEEFLRCCENCNVEHVYNLVDYKKDDEEMHIWVTNDCCMENDEINEIIYKKDRSWDDINPKFDYDY